MPNYCNYSIKIVGSKENCYEFVKKLSSYEETNHFWRIFESDVYDEEMCGDNTALYIAGYCAWSLESCCRASGYSNGIDLFEENTRDLGLKMEAYSREPGLCFEEHYIYDNGECIEDECLDISVFWWDKDEFPTYEDFKKEYEDAPPERFFDDCDEVYLGGFEENYENWHI